MRRLLIVALLAGCGDATELETGIEGFWGERAEDIRFADGRYDRVESRLNGEPLPTGRQRGAYETIGPALRLTPDGADAPWDGRWELAGATLRIWWPPSPLVLREYSRR